MNLLTQLLITTEYSNGFCEDGGAFKGIELKTCRRDRHDAPGLPTSWPPCCKEMAERVQAGNDHG
jgi:hypothetical protein